MEPASGEWQALLRQARAAVGLSRQQLAERSGVAAATIKSYELGLRNPSRPLLTALLEGTGSDRFVRNQVLEAAGFKADGLDIWRRNPDFSLTFDEALAEIMACPWPAILTGEGMKLLASNAPYDRLWGWTNANGTRPAVGDVGASLLAWLSHRPYADRVKNWDEVMTFLIGELKGSLRFPEEAPEGSSPYVRAALERFFAGDARYVHRYLKLWDTVPSARAKGRFSYRVVLDHITLGDLSFRCLGMGVNELDGLIINDWIPENAATWEKVAR